MNVLWILEDALRPDHMGCYGYKHDTTPNCDRLAGEGVRFDCVIATAAHTLPPIVSMVMSQWPATHGVVDTQRFVQWIDGGWDGVETPLHTLERAGYCVDGELVMRWAPLGFTRDTPSDEIPAYFERRRNDQWFFYAEPYPTHLPYNPPAEYFEKYLEETPSPETMERLEIVRNFLIVHPVGMTSKLEAGEPDPLPDDDCNEAHRRTAAAVDLQPQDRGALNALYDGEVRVFDDLVGEWVSKLETLGILDDTLIILTADHGEELMERGHVGHCSCNLMGTLYDESIRVPLILRYPKRLKPGTVVNTQVSHIDIMPTLFAMLGLSQHEWMEGQSLLPLIDRVEGSPKTDRDSEFRETTFSETTPAGWQALSGDDRQIFAIRTAAWKVILHTDAQRHSRRLEIYDLARDPDETNDLAAAPPVTAAPLIEQLDIYASQQPRHLD